MKQIYYVIQALIHGRGANIIKVVSLGFGPDYEYSTFLKSCV